MAAAAEIAPDCAATSAAEAALALWPAAICIHVYIEVILTFTSVATVTFSPAAVAFAVS